MKKKTTTTTKSTQTQTRRRGNPAWYKGMPSANPKGRGKGHRNKYRLPELIAAINAVEDEDRKSLLKHFVRTAFKSDRILVAIMKKLVPDLKALEAVVSTMDMSTEQAESIREKLRQRFDLSEKPKSEDEAL